MLRVCCSRRIDAQANPEESLGDYLPTGLPRRLEKVHEALLPPFGGKAAASKVYKLRFQNARDAPNPYPRMVSAAI